ncbi:DUF3006 domain-containing protein [Heliobacterium chlorum]|uniref:DUF3006 domain-containing protein n=1 Tax=Heliobacterium chlorum TaxID=2698 RepID=A0ABR7T085_HELCL|nr:DUF3006 domain-containing protein [Heliobacterium chlorum]MBC9783086.1 DUF3006 domain-containing protein [Heliobacterium chlorum]
MTTAPFPPSHVTIDRFEKNWAVIETEDGSTFSLPRSLLPAEAREGDLLLLHIEVDNEATARRREAMARTMEDFFNA